MRADRKLVAVALGIVTVGLLIFFVVREWEKISNILAFVFYGIAFAYILIPISRWIEAFMPRPLAVIVLFSFIMALLVLFFMLFIPAFIRQSAALMERIPQFASELKVFIQGVQNQFERLGLPYSVQQTLDNYVENFQARLVGYANERMDGLVYGLVHIPEILTIPVLTFYFIKDREHFYKIISGMVPSAFRRPTFRVAGEINEILHQFIRGQVLIALIVGFLTTIGYFIIGLPYALVIGLTAGIFEIIPYFGPLLGAIPAVLIAFLNTPAKLLWTVIVIVVVQQVEGNILTPKIMGDHVGLHPVYIILALWIGGVFFGIPGLLFSVPVLLILKVVIKNIYVALVTAPNTYIGK